MSETLGDARSEHSDRPGRGSGDERPSLPERIGLFYRQVVAELRKVIWPTRTELITYTTVVVVFVVAVAVVVGIFDYVFTKGVLQIFGN